MPSWSPLSATRRTSGAVISRLMRCDLLSSAMGERLLGTLKKLAVLARQSLVTEASGEVFQAHRAEIFAAARAHGHSSRLHLLIPDHKLVGKFLQAVFANLIGDLLVSQIPGRSKALFSQVFYDALGVPGLALGNVHDHHLLGGEPD